MFRRFAVPGLLLVAALLAAPGARAQNFSETRRGEGIVTRPNQGDDPLREASVSLRSDGSARLVFSGRSARHTFEGRWTRGSRNEVDLRVEGNFGDDKATATGELYLQTNGRGFERLTLNGSSAGRRFYVRFEADSSGRPWDDDDWRPGNRPQRPTTPGDLGGGNWDNEGNVNGSQNGSGRARVSGRGTYNLNRASVNIRSDRDVRVVFYGETTQSFGGRVTRRSGENVYVRLEGDILGDKTILEGYINVRRNGRGFDRIVLDSRSGRSLNINFTAR